MKYYLLLFSFVTFFSDAFTQSPVPVHEMGIYGVGYRNLITIDSARTYKPTADAGNRLHFRPVEIDFWYPAQMAVPGSPASYGYFLNLLQERSNRFQDDTVYTRMSPELTAYICANLKISDTSRLTHLPTASNPHASPYPARFPLIIYFCSYNGMSYENIPLFEWLASHGYIVACITSAGRYPGNMSTQLPDLMEQVSDGAFAIRYLKMEQLVDGNHIGVMGYSWGGLAAMILTMNNTGISCLLSLDGSELHYYGDSKEEDRDFDQIRNSVESRAEKSGLPNSYLESGFKQSELDADSIFNNGLPDGNKNLYVHFPKAVHEDFSCLPSLGIRLSGSSQPGTNLYPAFEQLALYYFDQYLKNKRNELPSLLDSIIRTGTGDTILPKVKNKKDLINMQGGIVDDKNRKPLAYVNVGIQNKNTGTVSGKDGNFQMKIYPELRRDSLTFSMAGYQTRLISIPDFLNSPGPVTISLKEKIIDLKEVIVTAKAIKTEIKGNTTTSNFISVGLPLKFLGTETGIRLHLGKKPVLLKSFRFNISDNRLDTAVFRLNIYQFKNGAPFENILHQNILIPVGKQTGLYTLNLTDYKLVLDGDVLLSIERIEGSRAGTGNGIIFLSAGFLNSATWHRLTSQAEWKKASGLGVGFNVLVQKFKE